MVIRVDTDDEDDVITVELIGGITGHPVTLDADRNIVLRIIDSDTESVKVVVTHTDESGSLSTAQKTYTLNLELEPEQIVDE